MSAHELAAEARSPFSPASLACPPHWRACRAQASRITPGNMHLRYVRRADPRSEAEARLDCKWPVVCWWMEGTYNSRMNWPTECAHIDRSGGGWGDATCTCVPHVYYEPCPGVIWCTRLFTVLHRKEKSSVLPQRTVCALCDREGGAGGVARPSKDKGGRYST